MKIDLGFGVANMSGSIGGVTAARNKNGMYLRNRSTGINPQTPSQLGVRAVLTQLAQQWATLTAPQRLAWDSAVGSFATSSSFGTSHPLSGIALFVKCNSNILHAGGSVILVPPAAASEAAITALSLTSVHAGATTVTYTPTPIAANTAYQVRMTSNLSAGITFVKNHYRTIAYLAPAAASPYVATTAWNAKFGAPVAGEQIWVSVKAIGLLTGFVSTPIVASCIVS